MNGQRMTQGSPQGDITGVTAGAGLTGGGIAGTVTLDVVGDASITVAADSIGLAAGVAGGGLTLTTGVLAVGAGSGITVNADDVALATTAAGAGLTYTAGVLAVVGDASITVAADSLGLAAGVAGGGLTLTTGVLAVGAGSGITVNADDVALATTAAGAGLTYTAGVLAVVGDASITVAADSLGLAAGVAGAGLTLTAGVLDVVGDASITVAANSLGLAAGVAGAGLTLTAGVLDVVGDASITVAANSLGLATGVAGAGLTLTTGVLAVGAGTGVTVAADTVAVDQAFAPTWTGAHTFNLQADMASSSGPALKLVNGASSANGGIHFYNAGAVVGKLHHASGTNLTLLGDAQGLFLQSNRNASATANLILYAATGAGGALASGTMFDLQNAGTSKFNIAWDGGATLAQSVNTSGSPTALTVTGAAHTSLALSTEAIDVNCNLARTVQFATGALTTQRAFVVQAPTYAFVGASTITTAVTLDVTGPPVAGLNATLTNAIAIRAGGTIQSTGLLMASGTGGGTGFRIGIAAAALQIYEDGSTTVTYTAGANGSITRAQHGFNTSGTPGAGAAALRIDAYSNTGQSAGITSGQIFRADNNAVNKFNVAWDAGSTWVQSVNTSGSPTLITLTAAAHTTLAASTEAIDVNFNLARTVQFATGALTTQRAFVVQAPTYAFVAASTITTAVTLTVTGPPVAGTNATITNALAFLVDAGAARFDGNIGFYGVAPIAQGASVADATGGATIDAEARTAINALISRIEATGLIATV